MNDEQERVETRPGKGIEFVKDVSAIKSIAMGYAFHPSTNEAWTLLRITDESDNEKRYVMSEAMAKALLENLTRNISERSQQSATIGRA